MRTGSPVLDLKGVTKWFGSTRALSDIQLSVPLGATLALIGPSGCGKSTLLRVIVGLISPDEGTIEFEGTPLTPDELPRARRRMGYVIQDGGLFPHLTARDNIALMARHVGWSRERIAARISELTALTHTPTPLLDRFPIELSGGQRQRISLMRALMLDPDVLLLDEPLAALDPMIRAALQDELRDLFAALGKTVLLVTHDLNEAAFFADRIVLLHDGRIVQQGELVQFLRSPAEPFVTEFVHAQQARAAALSGAA